MANPNSSTMATSSASAELEPLHVPMSPFMSGRAVSNEAQLASQVQTVTRGAQVVADILRSDIIERDSDRRPLLDVNAAEALAGLLSETLRMLANVAEQRIDFFNSNNNEGA